jgi:hypothetical protein
MNATPNEELPSEDIHHGTSYYFLNVAPLPKNKITVNFKIKKRKITLRFSHPRKEHCPGRNEDEGIDNLPSSLPPSLPPSLKTSTK